MEAFFDDGGVGDGGRIVIAIAHPASIQLECAALQEEEVILLLFTGAGLIALFFRSGSSYAVYGAEPHLIAELPLSKILFSPGMSWLRWPVGCRMSPITVWESDDGASVARPSAQYAEPWLW